MRHPRKIHASFQMALRTNPCPEEPSHRNTFATVTGAKEYYKREARDSGHDYMLANGGPASWADLYDASGWDGVSYGDPYARLEFTSDRMGIQVEPF